MTEEVIKQAKEYAQKIDTMIEPLRDFSDKLASPVLDLGIRLYMANIFFKSGMLKFKTYLNGNWDNTVYLFKDIHPIPGIPAEISAFAGTAGDLILSVLLVLGLFGRFAAAGLLFMTITIQYIVPADYGVSHPQHYFWMLLLMTPLFKGPGILSVDHFLLGWLRAGKGKKKTAKKAAKKK